MSAATMQDTARWAEYFANDWQQETPTRIHGAELAADGTPRWHPSFEQWLTGDRLSRRRNDEQRLRTTRVMRRLRRVAVREYEVLYRILVLGERLEETTLWLNDRAARNAIPFPPYRPNGPHYSDKDTYALVVAGIDFARAYW
jgi:hypothetical protein